MAEEQTDQDAQQEEAGGNKRKKWILLAVIGVVLIALSVGGTLVALKLFGPQPEPTEDEAQTEETAKPPAIYFAVRPPLIVNYDARGRQRYLQAELTLLTRSDETVNALELHMPRIRNNLVLLFGAQDYGQLQTAEGKELLRQQALLEVQKILEEETGEPGVEQVLFTNFVMQ